MANKFYPKGRESFCKAEIDWLSDDIQVACLDATYVYSASHQFYSSAASALVGSAVSLSSKDCTDGILDAARATFVSITGADVTQVVIFKNTGVAGTSRLIIHIDTAANLPFTPAGLDEYGIWDTGVNKIGKL